MIPGRITISRVNSSHSDNYIKIDVVDELSDQVLARVEMDFESFAKCITGQGHSPCQISKHSGNERVGMQREVQPLFIKKKRTEQLTRAGVLDAPEYKDFEAMGYELAHDGLNMQQRDPEYHQCSVQRFTQPEHQS